MKKPVLIFGLILYFLYVPCLVLAIILIFNLCPENPFFTTIRGVMEYHSNELSNWFHGNEDVFPVSALPLLLAEIIILVGFIYTTVLSLKFHSNGLKNFLNSAIDDYKTVQGYDDFEGYYISSSGDIHRSGGGEQHSGFSLAIFALTLILQIALTPITFPIETIIRLKYDY